MRSLTSGISGQLTTSGAFAGWLVEFALTNGQYVRLTSIDTGFTYNGLIFAAVDMELPSLQWDGTILRPGKLVIGDADVAFWALAIELLVADATVTMWQVYNAAAGEAEPVWYGRAGQVTRNADRLACEIQLTNLSDTQSAPRKRVQEVVSPTFLVPAGTVFNVSGQQWTIERPRNAAG